MISETSKLCYKEIIEEGLLGHMQEEVYICLFDHPDITDKDISRLTGLDINCVTPRRGELVTAGLVESNGKIRQVNGRLAQVWGVVR